MNRQNSPSLAQRDSTDIGGAMPSRWGWPRLLVGTLCQTMLACVVALALWAAVPAAFGWTPTTVSSGSMLPRLFVGDVAVSRPLTGAPSIRQVLLFGDPDHPGKLRLHRFVGVDDQGRLITRGDANDANDSTPVAISGIKGTAVLRVPFIGAPIVWIREGRWLQVAAAAVALLLLAAGARLQPRNPDHGNTDGGQDGDTDMSVKEPVAVSPRIERGWRRVTRVGAAALTVSVFTVGVATVISVPAAAGLTSTTTNPTSTFSGATYWKCTSAVLAGSPFLFYPLNESNGTTAVDGSGNGRNGTYRGGVSLGATDACPRDSGTAVTFNGTTNYLSTPSLVAAPDTFTLSTWFKTTTVRGGRIIGFGDSSTGASTAADRHIYMTNAGKLVFGVKPSSTMTITSSNPYNDGAWHQVSATLSTGGMRLYVDGSLVASDAATTSGHAMNGYWRISYDSLTGWPNVPTSAYFAGTLDNVAIYTTALTATSINAGYEAGR